MLNLFIHLYYTNLIPDTTMQVTHGKLVQCRVSARWNPRKACPVLCECALKPMESLSSVVWVRAETHGKLSSVVWVRAETHGKLSSVVSVCAETHEKLVQCCVSARWNPWKAFQCRVSVRWNPRKACPVSCQCALKPMESFPVLCHCAPKGHMITRILRSVSFKRLLWYFSEYVIKFAKGSLYNIPLTCFIKVNGRWCKILYI
mgnify:CR=1 FL=1